MCQGTTSVVPQSCKRGGASAPVRAYKSGAPHKPGVGLCGIASSAVLTLLTPVKWQYMDMSWVTDRIAVGGGIWRDDQMREVVAAGITHIVDMQIEFDDTKIAAPYDVEVLWNPTDDDFRMKEPELLER